MKQKLTAQKRFIPSRAGKLKLVILRPETQEAPLPGILWIHGGGYTLGMPGMVRFSCGRLLAERFGAVVVSPGYRLAGKAPYPAALEDCVDALLYLDAHREELGIGKLIVGGESAGGGLAAAVCLYARDHGGPKIDFQFPLYPMLDCEDTETSRDNHGKIWNTRRNHRGWRKYLGALYGTENVPAYASPSRAECLAGLPPCYTYVGDGEPFCAETKEYVARLKAAGVEASADVFHTDVHAFDRMTFWTEEAKAVTGKICKVFSEKILGEEES